MSAYANLKSSKSLTTGATVVLALAFASMVTASYTADNIKRSKCDMSKDSNLQSSYRWATGSAVISALIGVGMVATLIGIGMKPKIV